MTAEGSAWFAAAGTVAAVLVAQLNASAVTVIATSILAGQCAAFARVALVVRIGPLGWRFMRDYIDAPGTFLVGPPKEGRHQAALLLDGMEMHHVATAVHDAAADAGVFDLHQTTNQLVTAAVNRRSGSVTVLSALSDGRILQTAPLLAPSAGDVVVVHVPAGTVSELARAHRTALHQLVDQGVSPVRCDPTLFVQANEREHRAYTTLGPLASCVLELAGAPGPLTCRVACAAPVARAALTPAGRGHTPVGTTSLDRGVTATARGARVGSSPLAPASGRPAI